MSCSVNLGSIHKPQQYFGHEDNAYHKDFASAAFRLAIAFPDAYEVGMSNVGLQIIYHIINEEKDFMADRVYAPLTDMGDQLKSKGLPLVARESQRPISEFDAVGFTLQYEMCYTNVLYMLDLAGIPLRASARRESDPLVMAGGPCVFNPEPVAAFFDFFVIGEGEEVILEVADTIARTKAEGMTRAQRLKAVSRIPGVYVPSYYSPIFREDGSFDKLERLDPSTPRWVERRIIKDLDTVKFPTKPVTPSIKPIHERISVEIQRGCTRSCRFCQAGYIYRPRRERSPQKIVDLIEESVKSTGIYDIGLLSLSSADYSQLYPVMRSVMDRYKNERLNVSLPSTRLEALRPEYLDVLGEERRTGFTIAPEAGSQRLRAVINKNFTEEEIIETARMLFKAGWQNIKMYFMIGIPTETDDDVRAIAELGNLVVRKTAEIKGRKNITISVSNFVPKPHTPFQWHAQISLEEMQRKQKLIRSSLKFRELTFRSHHGTSTIGEALVARGSRRTAELIERAYALGARFDCWQDKFDLTIWQRAVDELKAESGYDHMYEAMRPRAFDEQLPWHRIYSGIHPKFFKNEYDKAVHGIATEDCSFSSCHECGLCNEKSGVAPLLKKDAPLPVINQATKAASANLLPEADFRIQYRRTGSGAFISALDIQSNFLKAFKRADILIAYDNGIRPRPHLTLGPALSQGVTSNCELVDIRLKTLLSPDELIAKVNPFVPPELHLLTATLLEPKSPGITSVLRGQSFTVGLEDLESMLPREAIAQKVAEIERAPTWPVERERVDAEGRTSMSVVDIKQTLKGIKVLENKSLAFSLTAANGQNINPFLVLMGLTKAPLDQVRLIPMHKTGILTAEFNA